MPDQNTRFGLTLPNRGFITGATTVDEMFTLAQKAEKERSRPCYCPTNGL